MWNNLWQISICQKRKFLLFSKCMKCFLKDSNMRWCENGIRSKSIKKTQYFLLHQIAKKSPKRIEQPRKRLGTERIEQHKYIFLTFKRIFENFIRYLKIIHFLIPTFCFLHEDIFGAHISTFCKFWFVHFKKLVDIFMQFEKIKIVRAHRLFLNQEKMSTICTLSRLSIGCFKPKADGWRVLL
jgi:hypothetical protein